MFRDQALVRDMQSELDQVIQKGVTNITSLVLAAETLTKSPVMDDEDDFQIKHLQQKNSSRRNIDAEHTDDSDDDSFEERQESVIRKLDGHKTAERPKASLNLAQNFRQAKNSGIKAPPSMDVGRGQLATQLIKGGLLTPEMLAKLQAEWQAGVNGNENINQDRRKQYQNKDDSDRYDVNPRRPFSHRRGRKR